MPLAAWAVIVVDNDEMFRIAPTDVWGFAVFPSRKGAVVEAKKQRKAWGKMMKRVFVERVEITPYIPSKRKTKDAL